MEQVPEAIFATGVPLFALLGMFAVFLLLVYLATKAKGRTIGIVLGAGILLMMFSFLFTGRSSQRRGTQASYLPTIEVAVEKTDVDPHISNKELWDRLTKSHIDLSEEKTVREEDNIKEDQTPEEDNTESKPTKPDWVKNPPKRVGNLFRRVVSSEQYYTTEECHQHLEQQLQRAARERVQTLVADGDVQSIFAPDPDSFGIGLGYIMREICQDEYTETLTASFGEMKRVYVLMEFSPAVENHLLAEWKEHERRHRLGVVGIFAAATLSLLAGVYGLLRFDTWTRGYYTKRLLVGVPVVIIVAVVLLCY